MEILNKRANAINEAYLDDLHKLLTDALEAIEANKSLGYQPLPKRRRNDEKDRLLLRTLNSEIKDTLGFVSKVDELPVKKVVASKADKNSSEPKMVVLPKKYHTADKIKPTVELTSTPVLAVKSESENKTKAVFERLAMPASVKPDVKTNPTFNPPATVASSVKTKSAELIKPTEITKPTEKTKPTIIIKPAIETKPIIATLTVAVKPEVKITPTFRPILPKIAAKPIEGTSRSSPMPEPSTSSTGNSTNYNYVDAQTKTLKCFHCNLEFTDKYKFYIHLKNHENKGYTCSSCKKFFATKLEWNCHTNIFCRAEAE